MNKLKFTFEQAVSSILCSVYNVHYYDNCMNFVENRNDFVSAF